jgi:hypothetical protein
MSTGTLQYYRREKKPRQSVEFIEAHHRMPDGRLIALVQICYNCNRQFAFSRRRRHCPSCQQLLRTKTMIFKKP